MRDPGLEQATRVAGRSHAPASVMDARAEVSVHSPPPSGDALGESDLPQPGLDVARAHPMDDIDTARAQEYALLSDLLARAPDAALLSRLAELCGDASPLGVEHAALAPAARRRQLV